jgi:alpha-beta hydrolase superfamily lysophospholipase
MTEVRASSLTLQAPDGCPIHVYVWLPAEEPRAIVQIAHGMAEHAGRYAFLAEALVARGIGVYANDHRGHGRSVPGGEEPGDMGEDGFASAVRVVRALERHIAEAHPRAERILFGHSMGSFMVQRFLCEHPEAVHAAILSGSNGKPPPIAAAGRLVARIERLRVGPKGTSGLLQVLSFDDFNKKFAPTRTDFDWLSRDAAQVDTYIADPRCGFPVSTQTWVCLLDALGPLTDPDRVECIPKDLPLYVFAGEKDAVGDFGRGVRRLVESYRAAGLRDVELKLYPEGRHEMLNEINREEVVSDLLAWIEKTLAKL